MAAVHLEWEAKPTHVERLALPVQTVERLASSTQRLYTTPVRRLDETGAAKPPVIRQIARRGRAVKRVVAILEEVRASASALAPRRVLTQRPREAPCREHRLGRVLRDETEAAFAFPTEEREMLVASPRTFLLPTGVDLRWNWVVARWTRATKRRCASWCSTPDG